MSIPKISLAIGGARKARPLTNGVKRSRSAFHDEDDEETPTRSENVSHFDKAAGGAIDEANKKADSVPLTIPKLANRNWKEAANKRKRQKSRPSNHEVDQQMQDAILAAEESKPKFGLNIIAKREEQVPGDILGDGQAAAEAMEDVERTQQRASSPSGEASMRQKTEDELAMDALLGRTTKDTSLVVPQAPITEADAFQHDVNNAPEMASLEEYDSMPVDQFGMAMLRGMGWKDGEGIGSQQGMKLKKEANKPPQRRANLLGIGAKEDAAMAAEMGVWGKAARGGKGEVKIYNPVLLRDKKTGEMFTEDELKKKQAAAEREKHEMEFERKEKERDRKRRKEEDADSRDSRRRRDKDGRRHDDHRRDRDRDSRRRDDDESDEERRRRKEKERRRRVREREERDGSDHDRERSRKHRDHADDDRRRDHHRSDRDRRR